MNYIQDSIPREFLNLINEMFPNILPSNPSISDLLSLTKNWLISRENRLNLENLKSSPYDEQVRKAASAFKLRKTKYPDFQHYDSVLILGGTGLSQFYIWKDLLFFTQQHQLTYSRIFLLGGDRQLNPLFDSLEIAFKYFPVDFKSHTYLDIMQKCQNEMEMMQLIASAVKLPDNLININSKACAQNNTMKPAIGNNLDHPLPRSSQTSSKDQDKINIPVISVFTQKQPGESQANTEDSFFQLLKEYSFPIDASLLLLGTLPYIARQTLQARLIMPSYKIDSAATFHPLLETIDTPLKGELPTALYLDEFHWLLTCIEKINFQQEASQQ